MRYIKSHKKVSAPLCSQLNLVCCSSDVGLVRSDDGAGLDGLYGDGRSGVIGDGLDGCELDGLNRNNVGCRLRGEDGDLLEHGDESGDANEGGNKSYDDEGDTVSVVDGEGLNDGVVSLGQVDLLAGLVEVDVVGAEEGGTNVDGVKFLSSTDSGLGGSEEEDCILVIDRGAGVGADVVLALESEDLLLGGESEADFGKGGSVLDRACIEIGDGV